MGQENRSSAARHVVWLVAVMGCGSSGGLEAPGIAVDVSGGGRGACALVSGGVQCWGDCGVGPVENGVAGATLAPVWVIPSGAGVTSVSQNQAHGCAVVHGAVECWGDNHAGALGNGLTGASRTPVPVSGLADVSAVSVGGDFACAIVEGGVSCWGGNDAAQLGTDAPSIPVLNPIPASMLASGVTAISAGNTSACAVVYSAASCWGSADPNPNLGPSQVDGLGPGVVAAIAAGADHTCAVVDGGAWCWGANLFGGLGNSALTVDRSDVPVPVDGLSAGVTAVASGGFSSCAIVNGGVQCWGANAKGQLGNNSTVDSASPVPVTGLAAGVTAISVGDSHACAVVDGGVKCWGDNSLGELGDGTQRSSLVPVSVKLL